MQCVCMCVCIVRRHPTKCMNECVNFAWSTATTTTTTMAVNVATRRNICTFLCMYVCICLRLPGEFSVSTSSSSSSPSTCLPHCSPATSLLPNSIALAIYCCNKLNSVCNEAMTPFMFAQHQEVAWKAFAWPARGVEAGSRHRAHASMWHIKDTQSGEKLFN